MVSYDAVRRYSLGQNSTLGAVSSVSNEDAEDGCPLSARQCQLLYSARELRRPPFLFPYNITSPYAMSKKRNLSASQRVPPLVKHLVGQRALTALDVVGFLEEFTPTTRAIKANRSTGREVCQ